MRTAFALRPGTAPGFMPVPNWTLLEQRHNKLALWLALDAEEPPSPVQALAAPQTVMVWRKDLQPHFRSIAADERDALQMLHGGSRFADLTAGRWLQRWLDEELLAAVTGR